ncbi:MAG: hypothetical protein ACRCTI_16845, partial [Beijerinckiaceae bacterium]
MFALAALPTAFATIGIVASTAALADDDDGPGPGPGASPGAPGPAGGGRSGIGGSGSNTIDFWRSNRHQETVE